MSRAIGYTHESVAGGMGRTVRDVQLQLRALAGHDPSVPNSLPADSLDFGADLEARLCGDSRSRGHPTLAAR